MAARRDQGVPAVKTLVLVTDLVKAIERVRDDEVKALREKLVKYKAERAAYVKTIREHVKSKLAQIGPDFSVPKTRRWGTRDLGEWLTEGLGEEPVYPGDEKCIRQKYDGLIAQLKMSAEPKVRLYPDDYRKFMLGDSSACVC